MVAWYMLPSHRLPAPSARRPRLPVGASWPVLGIGEFGDLAGLGIEPAEILLAETGEPGDAVLIDDHVMRRDFLARQVVFGIDHAGRPAASAAARFSAHISIARGAEIDRAEILRDGAIDLDAVFAAVLPSGARPGAIADGSAGSAAHSPACAAGSGSETVGVVFRAHDALDPVAADAIEQLSLLRIGAGDAFEPFDVRQLGGEVSVLPSLRSWVAVFGPGARFRPSCGCRDR